MNCERWTRGYNNSSNGINTSSYIAFVHYKTLSSAEKFHDMIEFFFYFHLCINAGAAAVVVVAVIPSFHRSFATDCHSEAFAKPSNSLENEFRLFIFLPLGFCFHFFQSIAFANYRKCNDIVRPAYWIIWTWTWKMVAQPNKPKKFHFHQFVVLVVRQTFFFPFLCISENPRMTTATKKKEKKRRNIFGKSCNFCTISDNHINIRNI